MNEVREHVDLQSLNTLSVPAIAEYFMVAESVDDVQKALSWAAAHQQPVMVLSGGSNIVLQNDVPGLCLHIQNKGIQFQALDNGLIEVTVAAGENWHQFVESCLQHNAYGLENLALIPGLVGAAPVQNIGAYGVEVKDFIDQVRVVRRVDGEEQILTNSECQFAYRDSLFKTLAKDEYIITGVMFHLNPNPKVNIAYQALQAELEGIESPTPQDVFDAVVAIRSRKLPDPKEIANVGSFFKNPVVPCEVYDKLRLAYPHIVGYPDGLGMKLAAGWLIDQAGWKGKEFDGVGVHTQQALVLTNPGGCKGNRVIELAEQIQADIRQQYGVTLEIEPRLY